MAFLPAVAQTAGETPMITFKTNIYDTYGGSNSFHIVVGATEDTYFDIDCGFGPEEVEVGQAAFDPDTQAVTGTTISLSVNSDGIVKIYGDPALLDYFDAEGCYIDWIDLGDCTNLDILDLQHNELKRLDLSRYTKLSAIYLTDNPYTQETPLIIGDNHPNLAILEVDITDWISPDFDISHYPNLISFDGYACKTLTRIDPSKCPNLMRLSVDSTPVSSVDVSKNPLLQVLNVEDSGVTELDLSNNQRLTQLYITHMSPVLNPKSKFSSIDLSNCPDLYYLAAAGNNLTSIDLSGNPMITHLMLNDNQLTSLDVDNLDNLYLLNVRKNKMNFATLPLPQPTWGEYYYEQSPLPAAREYKVGSVLDFSKEVLREGTVTEALLYSRNRATATDELLDESYYSYADGKVTLLKEYSDSVYVAFYNSAFMDSPLNTTLFKASSEADFGKPAPMASIGTSLAVGKPFQIGVGIAGATSSNPVRFFVDLGDGKLSEFQASTEGLPVAPNVVSTVKGDGDIIVYMPQGADLMALSLNDMPLFQLDLSQASVLKYLSASGTGLTSIDLGMNNNLRYLDLSDNRLASIDLSGANGALEKTLLRDIFLGNNRLTSVVLNDTRAIDRLDLSHNRLETFDYKEFEYIIDFNISHNSLQTINLVYYTAAKTIDVSHNLLEEVMMPETNVFETLRLNDNRFTLASLPYYTGFEYTYAPQAMVSLPAQAPGANLSAQNRVIDGTGTTFTWRKTADNSVVPAGKIECVEGRTVFLDSDLGSVYCEMTNPAFPDFKGDNMFRTTDILTAKMPTHCIATFTTPVGGEEVGLSLAAADDNTALFIDWSGEGYAASQYQLQSTYQLFTGETIKDAKVKVLTYSPDDKITVFSMGGATLTDADFSDMTDAYCLNISNAGLESITLPAGDVLEELSLDGNKLDENSLSLADYPSLRLLSLNDNAFTSLDLSHNKKLQVAAAGNNSISDLRLDNPSLWMMSLSDNELAEIDLSGAPAMAQLGLSSNRLSEIDVDGLGHLIALAIDQNRFTFATLPPVKDSYIQYYYGSQAAITPAVDDHKCDLSAQASVDGTPTVFRWFIGVPEFDENYELSGEELVDGEEYTIEDGITTFLIQYDGIMCVMTNEKFPSLYLYTNLLSTEDGIHTATSDAMEISATVIGGDVMVDARGVADATPVMLHSIDGRLLSTTTISDGHAVITAAPRGHAILSVGNRAFKVIVK